MRRVVPCSCVLVFALVVCAPLAGRAQSVPDHVTPVRDLAESPIPNPQNLVAADGILFFVAGPLNDRELWKVDESGATEIDLNPTGSSSPSALKAIGNAVFFIANDGTNGFELWTSNGATTTRLTTIPGMGALGTVTPAEMGGHVYFVASDALGPVPDAELWKTDAGAAGATKVLDIRLGPLGSLPQSLVSTGSTLFFTADDGIHGRELWTTDGTTTELIDVNPLLTGTPALRSSNPAFLTPIGDVLFFAAEEPSGGRELWRTDFGGTQRVADINAGPAGSRPEELVEFDGLLFFAANDGTGPKLWKSDGTDIGTVLVAANTAALLPRALTPVGSTLFFVASEGADRELWKSDGTAALTSRVKDINPTGPSLAASLTDVNGTLFFAATDGLTGVELWRSNGTEEGTAIVKDLRAGEMGSFPANLTAVGNMLFFTANDGPHGIELWVAEPAPPTITLAHEADGANGWNVTSPVTLHIEASDADSGLAGDPVCSDNSDNGQLLAVTGTAPSFETQVAAEGPHAIVCVATDRAGNRQEQSDTVKIDTIAPAVSYTGNAGTYSILDTVIITCSATDDGSGVAFDTCADITGPAYTFAAGPNAFSAAAGDFAGHTATATTTFTLVVTFDDLATLTRAFVPHDGVAHALAAKLHAVAAALARRNRAAAAGPLGAYLNQVAVQTGKALTPENAAILARLARALM